MCIKLQAVKRDDIETVWKMQVEAFADLLEKYQDHDISPAAESMDKVLARFEQPWTAYYFIVTKNERVGVIRVVDKKDGSRKRISPIWIMPEYRNKGYAQKAMLEAEKIYGSDNWCLDTILQEKGNLHLYEKLGYHQTGRVDKINDRMDIVYYEKDRSCSIEYKIATPDDMEQLMSSRLEMLKVVNKLDDAYTYSNEIIESSIEYFKNGDHTTVLARDGNRVIGCATICYIYIMPTFSHPTGKRAHLMNVYTVKEWQRRGIARKMVSMLIEQAWERGATEISLDATKEGRPLYEKLGFTDSTEGMVLTKS